MYSIKKKSKRIMEEFIKNSKNDGFSDKIATIKTLRKIDKNRFEDALKELSRKDKWCIYSLIIK